jgi:solute carrier family 25 citrate transporter 1
MISGLSYTVRTTGFTSLYRGLAPTLIGSIPKAGIRFGLNAVIKDALRDEDGKLTPGKNFVAGLGAGVTEALLVVAPVETVKTKVIEMNMPFLQGFRHIVKNEGMGGVYQGVSCLFSVCETRFWWTMNGTLIYFIYFDLWCFVQAAATAMKQGTNQGFRFMWFNEYKRIVTKDGEVPLSPIGGLLGGMSAGCFSVSWDSTLACGEISFMTPDQPSVFSMKTICNNPFDVVKTRMQGTKAAQYAGTIDCFKQVITKEGFGAFYAGVVPRLGRVVPGQGIIFMSFETIQSELESRFSIFRS